MFTVACTSPEQDEKIKSFWAEQAGNVMMKAFEVRDRFDSAASNSFSKRMAETLQNVKANSASPAEQSQQQLEPKPRQPAIPQVPPMLEITMDEEALPGKAPLDDRKLMKQALNKVELDNHATLQDLQTVFGESVKVKAFLITSRTETELKKAAANVTSFQAYTLRQSSLLQEQEQTIKQLMEQNKSHMKRLK